MHPAPLLEDRIDFRIEPPQRFLAVHAAAHDPFRGQLHRDCDALPFSHGRCRARLFELDAERLGLFVTSQRGIAPHAAPRRQITGQRMQALLLLRPRQELDKLPGGLLVS